MNSVCKPAILLFCFLLACASVAYAQQSPVITDKELLRIAPRPANEARTKNSQTPNASTQANPPLGAEESRQLAEERWAIRLRIAQERVKDLDRRADATELEINRLKNLLFNGEPRPAKTHKEMIADIDSLTAELHRLRAEAEATRAEVNDLLDEGVAAGFRTYSTVTAAQIGKGMSAGEYYRTRYTELKTELRDAESRTAVIQLRINDLNRRILLNSGTGDEFYNNRLRDIKNDLELELSDASSSIDTTNRRIEELRRLARAAGIYLNL